MSLHQFQNINRYEPVPYILLIDEDQDDLDMYSFELKLKGVKVRTFESTEKALVFLDLMSETRDLPSLIILDYNMPKKNGQQVLQILKQNKDTKNIPVVVYSTSISDQLRKQLSAAGALDCFAKPWNYRDIVTQVEIFQEKFIPHYHQTN